MAVPAIIFLDKWGRRPTLLLGSFFMMTWLFISGSIQAVYGQPNHDKIDNTKLQIASGAVRGVDGGGRGEVGSFAIAPF